MSKTPRHPHFDHVLPFWIDSNATFFVTICARQRGMNHFCRTDIGNDALAAAKKYHDDQKWFCSIIVLMPDHAHMLVSMAPRYDLAKTVGMWKRWLGKSRGIEWQPNFSSID
jgi:putative transposase